MTDIVRILIGPLVWLAAFSAVYALQGVACAHGWSEHEVAGASRLRLALSLAWMIAISLGGSVLAMLHTPRFRASDPFVRQVSLATAWVGLAATFWTLFPVVAMSACR